MGFPSAYEKFRSAMIAYEENLRAIGRSETTIQNEEFVFKMFSDFMLENKLWDRREESFTDIQAWRDQLRRDGKKPTTIRQYLTVLSALYNFASSDELGENRWYDRNPVSKLLMPDTRKLEKRPYDQLLTDEQVLLLWRNNPPKGLKRPYLWPRNYAIVILLLTTEIRNSELLALTPNDLDWENAELTVEHGKGDKFRQVDFPIIAQTAIRMYLNSGIRPVTVDSTGPLFGTEATFEFKGDNKGEEWHAGTRQWLSDIVRRHVKAVTGVDMIRSHDLRHVGARLDLNSGMTFEELQAKLGHESVSTTQVYSGKLTSRKNRRLTKVVQDEKERQARRNIDKLEAAGDDFFGTLRLKQIPQPGIA